MSRLRERCPRCSHKLIVTRFDTTFRLPDRTERLCFGIPGGLCEDCHQLYIDPDLIDLLEQVDEIGIDVELVAVFTQATRDAEAQALRPIRQAEGGVEPRHDELVGAARTALAES